MQCTVKDGADTARYKTGMAHQPRNTSPQMCTVRTVLGTFTPSQRHRVSLILTVFVSATQMSLHLRPLVHFLLIVPCPPLLLARHAARVTCAHVSGLLMSQQAPKASSIWSQKPHVLFWSHWPPCAVHCTSRTSVWQLLRAMQHAPKGSWSQKPHVLLWSHLPPCAAHCGRLMPVWQLPAMQQAPTESA
jgi:hypothetical protein